MKSADVSADQRVVLSVDGNDVRQGDADVGLNKRHIAAHPGGRSQAEQNTSVRQQFLNAVMDDLKVSEFKDLPDGVRKAFNVGVFRDDMKFGANGQVTSGRPLTARRIRAVLAAVEKAGLSRLDKKLARIAAAGPKVDAFVRETEGALKDDLKQALKSFVELCGKMSARWEIFKHAVPRPTASDMWKELKGLQNQFFSQLQPGEREALKTFSVFAKNVHDDMQADGCVDTAALNTTMAAELFKMDKDRWMPEFTNDPGYGDDVEDNFLADCGNLYAAVSGLDQQVLAYEAEHPQDDEITIVNEVDKQEKEIAKGEKEIPLPEEISDDKMDKLLKDESDGEPPNEIGSELSEQDEIVNESPNEKGNEPP